MDFPWLDLPFTFLTLLLATRLAYDYYGAVAATFAGCFSLQIFLFYCFARWYNQAMPPRADLLPSTSRRHDDDDGDGAPPVLTPLLETAAGDGPGAAAASGTLLINRCLAFVFMVFVPLVIVIFEQSQDDVVAYGLCLVNIVVMVVWLSPDSAASLSATKSFLTLSDDEEDEGDGSAAADSCCVCLAGMREEQDLLDLTGCGHRFHGKCIGKWLKAGHPTCPVCRALVSPPPARHADPQDDSISPV